MMLNFRRIALIVAGVIGVAAVGVGGYYILGDRLPQITGQADQAEPSYRVGTVERGDLREMVGATGPVEARDRSDVAFVLSGRVEQVNVVVGQQVHKGDLLMRLDTTQYELDVLDAEIAVELQNVAFNQLLAGPSQYDVASASAAVARAQAQLDQISQPPDADAVRLAQINLELRRSELWLVQLSRDDTYEVYGEGYQFDRANKDVEASEAAVRIAEMELINAQQGVSLHDIAVSRASVHQAQAALQRLLEGPNDIDLELAQLQIEQARLAVQSARLSLQDAEILAPFDGVVAAVNYEVGEQAAGGLPAVIVLDTSEFYIDLQIDELDIARIEEDQLVFINLDAWPDSEISGHVVRIAPEAVDIDGIVSYEVRVELDPAEGVIIRDGMTSAVDIVVSELTDVLLVPNWAIRFDRRTGQAFVNVRREDGTVEEVEIEVGTRGADSSEVLTGLQEGDTVVVSLEREELQVFGDE